MQSVTIGVAGRARRGKGTIVGFLAQWAALQGQPVQLVSLADPLKDFLTAVIGRSAPFRGTDEERNAPIPEITWRDFAPSFVQAASELAGRQLDPNDHPFGRQLLQLVGTDVIRKMWLPDVWVRIARNKAQAFPGLTFIDDCRFANECVLKSADPNGLFDFVLKVNRPGWPMSDHASEVAVDHIPLNRFDRVIENDGTLCALERKVHEWAATTIQIPQLSLKELIDE